MIPVFTIVAALFALIALYAICGQLGTIADRLEPARPMPETADGGPRVRRLEAEIRRLQADATDLEQHARRVLITIPPAQREAKLGDAAGMALDDLANLLAEGPR